MERRQGLNTQLSRQFFGFVGVDLDELHVGQFTSKSAHGRSNLLAVLAPWGPEINDSDTRSNHGRETSLVVNFLHGRISDTAHFSLVGGMEVSLGLRRIGLHGQVSRLPVGRAHLTVLLNELESLDQADDLINVAADRKIVDGDLAQVTGRIDDEKGTKWDAIGKKNTVLGGDRLGEVSDNRDLHVTQTTFLARSVHPGKMGEQGIARGSNDLGVDGIELRLTIAESNDLGRADEGEIQRIPEEDDPLASELRQRDILELLVRHQSANGEFRSRLLNGRERHGASGYQSN